jgi:integrase
MTILGFLAERYCRLQAGECNGYETGQYLRRSLQSRPVTGRREGQRMPLADVQRCLRLPDRTTLAGKRDYALLGVLFACGLRQAGLCNLEVKTIGRLNERLSPDRPGRQAPEGALHPARGTD